MDANEIEMKKKDKNFDSAPSSRAYLWQCIGVKQLLQWGKTLLKVKYSFRMKIIVTP
jgi:hypothetical protein